MLFTILRGFAHFWNGKGPIFGPKIGLENSLPIVISFKQLKHMFDKEKMIEIVIPIHLPTYNSNK